MDTEKSVGTILREARLAKHLSLAEVEKGTSIRSRYLEAMENDEYDKTPGEVFLKGMIRNYGNFLGLNGPELVKLYKASAAGVAAESLRGNEIREVEKVKLNIQLKDPRDIGSGTGRFEMPELPWKQIGAGLAAVVILAAGYVAVPKAIDYFKNRPSEPSKQEQKLAEGTKTAAALDKVQVQMEAADDCWTEVSADGKEIFAGMLKAKDKKTFEAKDKLIVKYGNIGVMKLVVNGEVVDLQGEHGVAVKTYLSPRAQAASEKEKAETESQKQEQAEAKEKAATPAPAPVVAPAPQAAPAPEAVAPAQKQEQAADAVQTAPQAASEAKTVKTTKKKAKK
ncbi:MAG: DUF4115 domain-containing protein [Phascolarctobacterium sp.]|nr:DUF4115 domain-containing protein [Phascolarctobacterium sp.]